MNHKKNYIVEARITSDDEVIDLTFEAVEYFKTASYDDIVNMEFNDFGNETSLDEIAYSLRNRIPEIDNALRYLENHPKAKTNEAIGFKLTVDSDMALNWMSENNMLRKIDI